MLMRATIGGVNGLPDAHELRSLLDLVNQPFDLEVRERGSTEVGRRSRIDVYDVFGRGHGVSFLHCR